MANPEHLALLQQGVPVWNQWRKEHPNSFPDLSRVNLVKAVLPGVNFYRVDLYMADLSLAVLHQANFNRAILHQADLSRANLSEADLRGADLYRAVLHQVDLRGAKLRGAGLSRADFSGADLRGARLERASLVETILDSADLSECNIYGISAWNLSLANTKQNNLIITQKYEPAITVDNLEVAQFVHLLLNNQKLRDTINTITSKTVLILGRFIPARKVILEAIRNKLRDKGFVPILFDFEKPTDRDFTETIMTLAGLCRFIIADITNPKSAPLELQATVPNYMIPLVPIIQEGEQPFSMFQDLQGKFDWVLDTLTYSSQETLIAGLEQAVILPALEMYDQLLLRKMAQPKTRRVEDYLQ